MTDNRLASLFERKERDILAVYFTAGYPRPDITRDTILRLDAAGADLIEIGIPFSDPLADGPTIQASSKAAIEGGMTLARLFTQLTDIRTQTQIPLVLMGYLNPVLRFGMENFCRRCQECGVDGVILPDMPLAFFLSRYQSMFRRHRINPVFLVTPQTTDERVRALAAATGGFLYAVSMATTTGGTAGLGPAQIAYFKRLTDLRLGKPILAGFGIADHASFRTACESLQGAVVGSAFIRAQEMGVPPAEFVSRLRGAAG
ncbi:MAG: hypothetical protein RLY31_225 [Bacteroidota bacterium]|jgi:tryptophan synthase alpha chain